MELQRPPEGPTDAHSAFSPEVGVFHRVAKTKASVENFAGHVRIRPSTARSASRELETVDSKHELQLLGLSVLSR